MRLELFGKRSLKIDSGPDRGKFAKMQGVRFGEHTVWYQVLENSCLPVLYDGPAKPARLSIQMDISEELARFIEEFDGTIIGKPEILSTGGLYERINQAMALYVQNLVRYKIQEQP